MNKKLLHIPDSYNNESPGSLLLRTSEANGWTSPSSLLVAMNYPYAKNATLNLESIFCNKEKWLAAVRLLGIYQDMFLPKCYSTSNTQVNRTVDFLGLTIPWKMLRLKKPAICPKCITIEPYQKSIWDLKLITACTIHDIKLIDTCPSCGGEFKWNRKKVLLCSCDYNIDQSPRIVADTTGTHIIEHLVNEENTKSILLLNEYRKIYSAFFELFELSNDEHHVTTISALSTDCNGYMQDTLLFYLREIIQSHGLHPRLILGHFLISKNQQIIENTNKVLAEFKEPYYFKNKKIPNIKIPVNMVSKILGITHHFTEAIFLKKNTQNKKNKKHKKKGEFNISLKRVSNLLDTLMNNSEIEIKGLSIPIKGSYHRPVNKIIEEILKGEIKYSTDRLTAKGLWGITLIERPSKETKPEDRKYFSIMDMAQICDVHPENIRFAVNCGFIKRVNPIKTKGTKIYIEKKEALEFNARYVFSGALASTYNTNPRTLAEKLSASGIMPVSGPRIDRGLTYLFKREEVKLLNFKKIASLRNYPTSTGRKNSKDKSLEGYSTSLASAANILEISIQKTNQLISDGHLIEYVDLQRRKSVTNESLLNVLDQLNSKDLVCLQQAAKELDQTEKEFSCRYIRTKLISTVETIRGKHITKKDFKKINKFHEKYITSKDAGKILGTERYYLHNLKRLNKIKPAKEFGKGNNKITFFNRNEVIALKGTLSSFTLNYSG